LVSATGSRDAAIRVGGPDERFWAWVVLGEEPTDRGLEADERTENAAFQAAAREPGEKPLTALSREAEVGVK
jgi:hypothetical protein